ncbi:MAG: hypothetical protein LBV45_07605 [Xanthomonadaceae bacterium]|nr:hypothetical protein [Xanthomonadaceae bacterium]
MKSLVMAVLAASAVAGAAQAQNANVGRDRQSILKMQGEYVASSSYEETVLLKQGYDRALPQLDRVNELVVVVQDTPTKVVLQHLALDPRTGDVSKSVRQDWTYEASRRTEFSRDQTWLNEAIPTSKIPESWTQCVYDASEAPLYCTTGYWFYADGIATWAGDVVWRPLPRREHSIRSDYNALRTTNRYTITPNGWAQEQFNTKVQRRPDGTAEQEVAREVGFTEYQRTNKVDFAPAHAYWDATKAYWARVRVQWEPYLASSPRARGVRLKTRVDGMALTEPLLNQAEKTRNGEQIVDEEIVRVLNRVLGTP